MLEHADRIAPWRVADFYNIRMKQATLYRNLKTLCREGLIKKVGGGYVLSPLILEAGTKQKNALMRINITDQENLHGKA
jgi:DNA-binding IclR family transcriptional regulator